MIDEASLSEYLHGIEVAGVPDLAGPAIRGCRRRRRVRTALAAGTALTVVAVAVVAGTGPRAGQAHPTVTTTQAGTPYPGFMDLASAQIPPTIEVLASSQSAGEIWAIGSAPATGKVLLLHAATGGTLRVVRALPDGAGRASVVVRDGVAIVVDTPYDQGTAPFDPHLRVYDATTAVPSSDVDLTTSYRAIGARLVVSAESVVVVMGRLTPDAGEQVSVAVLGAGGKVGGRSPYVRIPPALVSMSKDGTFEPLHEDFEVVTSRDGVPEYTFLAGLIDTIAQYVWRVDLRTGELTKIVTGRDLDIAVRATGSRSSSFSNACAASAVVGIVRGRLFYDSCGHSAVGSPSSTALTFLPYGLRLVAGHLFSATLAARAISMQEVDPATLKPFGPTVVQDNSARLPAEVAVVDLNGSGIATWADREHELGGTLTVYGPTG